MKYFIFEIFKTARDICTGRIEYILSDLFLVRSSTLHEAKTLLIDDTVIKATSRSTQNLLSENRTILYKDEQRGTLHSLEYVSDGMELSVNQINEVSQKVNSIHVHTKCYTVSGKVNFKRMISGKSFFAKYQL
jgi:hypothetical protein